MNALPPEPIREPATFVPGLSTRSPASAGSAPRTVAAVLGPRLLYVEDDAQLRRTICLVLTSSGYRVDTAVDGGRCLDQVTGAAI